MFHTIEWLHYPCWQFEHVPFHCFHPCYPAQQDPSSLSPFPSPAFRRALPLAFVPPHFCNTLLLGSFLLTTGLSVKRPPTSLLIIVKYLAFSSQGTTHPVTTVSSNDVEKAYLAFCAPGADAQAATLKFQAGKHKYELDFKGTPIALTQQSLGLAFLHSPRRAGCSCWGPGLGQEGNGRYVIQNRRQSCQRMVLALQD